MRRLVSSLSVTAMKFEAEVQFENDAVMPTRRVPSIFWLSTMVTLKTAEVAPLLMIAGENTATEDGSLVTRLIATGRVGAALAYRCPVLINVPAFSAALAGR